RRPLRRIAGVDLAFAGDEAVAACVILDYQDFKVIEEKTARMRLDFPYMPGFLWFREGPAIARVMKRLSVEPDISLVNAHGIAHPRRFGCASHIGVVIKRPTIGVAGSRLCAELTHLPAKTGERAPLVIGDAVVGWAVKPEVGGPIYISPGHMVSVESAAEVVINCLRGHRFPEPIYLSHRLANSTQRKLRNVCIRPSEH
ncbi:MAG: endonuclease V, partial [Candidatus Bathyarchaeia archaeon]